MHQVFFMFTNLFTNLVHELGSRAWFTSLVNEFVHEPIDESVYELTSRV